MGRYEVVFFAKEDGSRPACEFMDILSVKMRARLIKIVAMLGEYGVQVRMPYSEYLQDGIFQIRAQQEGNISRVLYFFAVGKTVVLTNGFTKRRPKRPPAEIELAKRYKADYERREVEIC